jgi:hypothetical protein
VLRRLLLLPVLAPLLALLIVAALNPRPATSLRMLTWRSPPLPLGLWIALAGAGGALLSAGATGLALRQGSSGTARTAADSGRWSQQRWRQESWEQADPPEQQPIREAQRPMRESPPAGGSSAGGSRAPGEPPPTVSVPFRVVRRGSVADPASAATPGPSARAAWQQSQPEPVPADNDWNSDWNSQASDDW